MRRVFQVLLTAVFLAAVSTAPAASSGKVIKVLPQFLDREGQHALSPSLFDRDAYQAQLRQHPDQQSAIRFYVNWRARAVAGTRVKLRVEMRGTAKGGLPSQKQLESELKAGAIGRWTALTLEGEEFKKFGEVTSWRVTLWDGEQLLGEQKSFLW